jgi:hypothetical protein
MLRPDAADVEAAVDAIDAASAKVPDSVRAAVQAEADVWPRALAAAASTTAERRLIATGGRVEVEDAGLTLIAGVGPALSGGLGAGGRGAGAIEYGSTVRRVNAPRRRLATGGPVSVLVGKGLRGKNADGYVAGPAAKAVEPALLKAMEEGYVDAFDGPFDVTGD